MSDDALYNFLMPPDMWRNKPSPSPHKMTIAYAAEHHPDATPILSTREVRAPLGTITADAPYHRSSTVKSSEMQAHHDWLVSRIGAKSEAMDNPPDEPN